MTNCEGQFFLLALNEIANWNEGKPCKDGILAEVPILQRGLVWDQSQIELLWDSILRGIPIGSMILCPINDSESIQKQLKSKSNATHFIIDGQQRYNAISLGYANFPMKNDDSSIIWLDLNPDDLPGTREFLVRLTTKAHPWGFNKWDHADKLGVGLIRRKLEEINWAETNSCDYIRPNPSEVFPFDAVCPIPIEILLSAREDDFWGSVISVLQEFVRKGFSWAERVIRLIESENFEKERILNGIIRAKTTRIIALGMPDFLLDQTKNEENNVSKEGITNIEHLFQRINSLGSNLEGEELVYSMIKSHFPEIAKTIDEVAKKRMPSSKLVQLSIRLALSDESGLKDSFNVSQIRKLASSGSSTDKNLIIDFIDNDLDNIARTVDKWLTNGGKTWGIPDVLKTGIAISSPDVYCLLLYLARKYPDLAENQYKKITGITLFIHWFFDSNAKRQVISVIYKEIYNSAVPNIVTDLQRCLKNAGDIEERLKRLQKPEYIEHLISLPEDNISIWDWTFCKNEYVKSKIGDSISEAEKNEVYLEYDGYINPFLEWLKGNRELLLYAQRDFLRKKFPGYDPANKEMWKQMNRPWDFDHILANALVKGKWDRNTYKTFCSFWVSTNGNLRVWPFEDNRSDQANKTTDKMKSDENWVDSFIDNTERDGYSDQAVIADAGKALGFAKSCKSRMIRIYKEWYNNFNIKDLLE